MGAMKRFVLLIVIALVSLVGLFAAWGYAPDGDTAALRAEYATADDRFVAIDPALTVRVRQEGPPGAPAIVLLHGSSSSLEDWDGWARALSRRYRVVRLDLPGHGLTGPDRRGRYGAADMAQVVDRVANKLGLDRFVLGGNSMGGQVAWTYALQHADRLAGLILVDPAGAPDNPPASVPIGFRLANSSLAAPLVRWVTPRSLVRSSVEDVFGQPAKVTDALVERYRDMLLVHGNRQATLERQRAARPLASAQQMATLTLPVLILWGGRDRLIPAKGAQWFDRALPNSRLLVLPDAGHIPMVEDPAASVEPVGLFLQSLTGFQAASGSDSPADAALMPAE